MVQTYKLQFWLKFTSFSEFLQEKTAYAGKMIMLCIFNRNRFSPSANRYCMKMEIHQFQPKPKDCKIFWATLGIFWEVRANSLATRHLWPLGSLASLTPITSGSQFSLCPICLSQKPHFSFYYTASGKRKALLFLFFFLPFFLTPTNRDLAQGAIARTARNFCICSLPGIEGKYKYLAPRLFMCMGTETRFRESMSRTPVSLLDTPGLPPRERGLHSYCKHACSSPQTCQ